MEVAATIQPLHTEEPTASIPVPNGEESFLI